MLTLQDGRSRPGQQCGRRRRRNVAPGGGGGACAPVGSAGSGQEKEHGGGGVGSPPHRGAGSPMPPLEEGRSAAAEPAVALLRGPAGCWALLLALLGLLLAPLDGGLAAAETAPAADHRLVAPVAKSVGWFCGSIHDLKGDGASAFLSSSNLTDRILPCCNSLTILPNGSLGPSHYGNFSKALYGQATEILVNMGGTAGVVPKIAARKEAFAQEVLQKAIELDVDGFTMDWEFGAVMDWASWNETMNFVADMLHQNGKKLGVCIESGCGDNLPSWRGGTNPPCATLFRNMPWADKLTDMGTYTLGGNTTASRHKALAVRDCPSPLNRITPFCGLEGAILNHLQPLHGTDPPEYSMRTSDGQYSAGLSPNTCTHNGTVAGGWTDDTLHAFLLWLDTVGVRSIDIWCGGGVIGGNGGCNTLSSGGPGAHGVAQPCTWFLRRITQWRFDKLELILTFADASVQQKHDDTDAGRLLPPGAQQLLPAGTSSLDNFSFWKMDGSGTYASRIALPESGRYDYIRVTTFGGSRAAPLTYRADFKGALPFAVHDGDVALIQFQARASPGATQPPNGTLLSLAFQDNVPVAKYFKFKFTTMKLTPSWQNWSFPVEVKKKDAPAGMSVIQFEFGFPNMQSFDLRAVHVHLWPKSAHVNPAALPSCCLPNSTYPGRAANATVR